MNYPRVLWICFGTIALIERHLILGVVTIALFIFFTEVQL